MSYAFGSLARNGGSSSSGQSDLMSMSDQELDAYIEAQYGDQLSLDSDRLVAFELTDGMCGACNAQDRMHRAYFAGNATKADLMGLYKAQGVVGLAGVAVYGAGPAYSGVRFIGGRLAGPLGRFLGPRGPIFGDTAFGAARQGILNNGYWRIGFGRHRGAQFRVGVGNWKRDIGRPIKIRQVPPNRRFPDG